MKINYLAILFFFSISQSATAQHWYLQENQFLYQDFWYDKVPNNVRGFYTATTQLWSPATQAWTHTTRLDNKFGTNNLPKNKLFSTWTTASNQWTLAVNDTLTFNANNSLQRIATRRPVSGNWATQYGYLYGYNASNLLTTRTSQNWTANNWESVERDSIFYQNNRPFLIFKQIWSPIVFIWGDDARDSLIYNANNLVSEYYWQANIGGIFRTAQRDMMSYNAAGKRTELRREFASGAAFDTIFRWRYNYNTRGHLDTMTREQYNKNARLWQSHSRVVFTVNTEGVVLVENFESADGSGGWRPNTRTTYNLTGTPTAENTEGVVFSVFPNPTSGFINLKADFKTETDLNLEVYDVAGRLVFSKNLGKNKSLNQSLNLSHLPNGAYFLVLNNGQILAKQKFVKW